MIGFTKINLRDISEVMEPQQMDKIISDFYCPYNADVEYYLRHKAIEFSKQGLASTYLVMASYQERPVLVGYFALTHKYFHIDLKKKGTISSTLRKRLAKFATYNSEIKKYQLVAPLIGQMGKNYANGYDRLISGDELLKLACDTVQEAQHILGGKVVYIECEDVVSLKEFYKRNGFVEFDRRRLDSDEANLMSSEYLIQMLKYFRK